MTPSASRDVGQRLALIHSSDELYGSDRMLLQIVDSMPADVRENVVVVLPITSETPGELTRLLDKRGVSVERRKLPILRRRDLSSALALAALLVRTLTLAWWLKRNRFAVVYCTTSAAALALPAARIARARRRMAHVQEVWEASESKLLHVPMTSAHQLVATSEAVRDALPRRLRRRTLVVPNGTAAASHPPVQRAPGAGLRFLMASRWSGRKGYGTLLAAWDAFATPPGTLVIAGSAPALGDAVDVPSMVAELAHPASVEMIGQVDSIIPLLDGVDAVIVPSDKPEAFGLIAVEAFSRGRAVIATAGGGLAEIVDHGVDGLLFEARNVDELRRCIDAMDGETALGMGREGFVKFEDQYSGEAFAGRMATVWDAARRDIRVSPRARRVGP